VDKETIKEMGLLSIIRLARELKIAVSEFPQFGLIDRITAAEEEQNLLGRSYTET
jgi:hypothetical protein